MIECREVQWPDIRGAILPLWERHWREIGKDHEVIPLDPDWEAYDRMYERGGLFVVGAFEGDNLVGYVFAMVMGHLHYKRTLCGFYDLYWLAPEHRKGMAGVRLFKAAEAVMTDLGCVKIFAPTKLWHDVGRLFSRMGWKPIETTYAKMLGD